MNKRLKFGLAAMVLFSSVSAWSLSADLHSEWSWPPGIAFSLLGAAVLYILGIRRVIRDFRAHRTVPTICFFLGWLSLLLALDSPIHEIGEQLFWVHMTQHEILMLIAAPLIALGDPLVVFLHALPDRWRTPITGICHLRVFQRLESFCMAPLSAWLISAAALWMWHLPMLFDEAVANDWIHAVQHTTFFLSALLFWWPLVGKKPAMGYGTAVLYVFTTALHTSVLGALLTFAARPWYRPYLATASLWSLTPLEDQQLGGLIMWIPAGTLLLVVALFLLARWLNESQTRWQYTQVADLAKSSQGVAQ